MSTSPAPKRELHTFSGSASTLEGAIEKAEEQASDAFDLIESHKNFSILNISSETLYAEDQFHYIMKYFIEFTMKESQ